MESDTAIPVMNPGHWMPQQTFPDCAVVTHSNSILTPSQLLLDIEDPNEDPNQSFCDDPFFIQQVFTEISFVTFLSRH